MLKTYLNRASIIVVILLLLFACKELKENTNISAKEAVAIDKMEAELLVDVTQKNLNTIAFCTLADTIADGAMLKQTLDTVRLEQEQIFNHLQNLAEDNLISVASRPTRFTKGISAKEIDSLDSLSVVKKLITQLKQQQVVLNRLGEKTDDEQIREIALKTNQKVEGNIQLSLQTLESLE